MFCAFVCQLLLLFVFSHYSVLKAADPTSTHWDYEREGPDTWPHTYDACEGDAQSPIDIRTSHIKYQSTFNPLVLHGYTGNITSVVWNFTHNGHTIVAYPPPSVRFSISGSNLPDVFYLLQFHLHWGYNAFQGSEHTINGRKYPLEIHFVHRAQSTGTLAVLGILFDRQRDDNPYLNDLLSALNRTANTSLALERAVDLSRLFPTSSSPHFYRYNGSLTTPPCTEGVIWTLLARTVPISTYQLRVFMGNMVPFNFRPTQKLHARPVLTNFRPEPLEAFEEEEGDPSLHCSASTDRNIVAQLVLFIFASIVLILQ